MMTAKQIRTTRRRVKMSQEAFARWVGVSSKTVSRWERGESKPSRMALEKLTALKEQK